ncbi:MAG: cyclic nucleotide-binding domain-containing protein [Nitrospinota bacterium]|nr:cyclic nucleotide-binding domain-containing protein [Nitrospinota bacterium]
MLDRESLKILMNEVPVFDQLTGTQRETLAEFINYAFCGQGKALFKEGDKGGSLYYIISGRVEIQKRGAGGKKSVLSVYRKGVTIGEMSLLEPDAVRSATIVAVEDTELLQLSRQNFEEILRNHPEIGIQMMRNIALHLSLRLKDASGKVADLTAITKLTNEGRHEIPPDMKDKIKHDRRS